MGYKTLRACISDLRKVGQLVDFTEPVCPHLELAAVQRRLFREGGPAVLFSSPTSCDFPMLANLYGTEQRLHYIFRDGIEPLRKAIRLGCDPLSLVTRSLTLRSSFGLGATALSSLYYSRPKKVAARHASVLACRSSLDRLPQLVSWPDDGGPYITLPQVYSEDPTQPGFGRSNIGMYRVQLSGNDYLPNREAGLHYQIHRGIAGHHATALQQNQPLRVNVFVGGTPAMTLAAIMPLPEGVSELHFAGILGQHRIEMAVGVAETTLPIYAQADFCLCGVLGSDMKREGPFGDHLGYYSLSHDFPVFRVEAVYHRRDAIWPFTVVGRPPQEDTMFGRFIHHLVDDVVSYKIPGVHAVHAVDESGVHPLLLALGREQYLPMDEHRRAAELHTLAHAIFGYGQLSLAKYLFLAAKEDDSTLDVHDIPRFFQHILQRVDWRKDVHFVTKTNADTLDYSDAELHRGSKLFVAASGPPIRDLAVRLEATIPARNPRVVLPGILCVEEISFRSDSGSFPNGFPLIVLVDDASETATDYRNFLWTTFTKSDPASDVHGIGEFFCDKHWGCIGPLVIDARKKLHHAPELYEPASVAERADKIVEKILE